MEGRRGLMGIVLGGLGDLIDKGVGTGANVVKKGAKGVAGVVSNSVNNAKASLGDYLEESSINSDAMTISTAVEYTTRGRLFQQQGYEVLAGYGIGKRDAQELAKLDSTSRELKLRQILTQMKHGNG